MDEFGEFVLELVDAFELLAVLESRLQVSRDADRAEFERPVVGVCDAVEFGGLLCVEERGERGEDRDDERHDAGDDVRLIEVGKG